MVNTAPMAVDPAGRPLVRDGVRHAGSRIGSAITSLHLAMLP